jgi:hypothetical protein
MYGVLFKVAFDVVMKGAAHPFARKFLLKGASVAAGVAAAKMVGALRARGYNVPMAEQIPLIASLFGNLAGAKLSPEVAASQTVQNITGIVPPGVGQIDATVALAKAQALAQANANVASWPTREIFTPPPSPYAGIDPQHYGPNRTLPTAPPDCFPPRFPDTTPPQNR